MAFIMKNAYTWNKYQCKNFCSMYLELFIKDMQMFNFI